MCRGRWFEQGVFVEDVEMIVDYVEMVVVVEIVLDEVIVKLQLVVDDVVIVWSCYCEAQWETAQ
jgi:hypothetical protein